MDCTIFQVASRRIVYRALSRPQGFCKGIFYKGGRAENILRRGRISPEPPVKELQTHAQAIPLLDFLIDDDISGVALSPNQVIPIRIPAPERFAIHKLFSSQSRRGDRGKLRKDLEQAAALAAAIEEETPERLSDAFRRVPREARPAVKRGAAAAARLLASAHPEAARALTAIAK